ncbi:M23 family metallopeptidase [Paenibacillus humicola]|uniref:M23 family metallopeptidase n=1 Tax=Paenibacillus humicola TaxID=3110540 RepID=UPI00237B72A8|nr:M23 family metallopeptidase [Paenibacillus humicola]
MGTKNGVRQRRQERMRRILEQMDRQSVSRPPESNIREGAIGGQRQPSPPAYPPPPASLAGPQRYAGPESGPGTAHSDPELLWKSQPNPWERAGWRMAPPIGASGGGELGSGPARTGNAIVRGLFIQTVFAAALFAIIYGMFHLDAPLAKKGQETVTAALTEQMNFQSAEALYRKMFAGAPSFIPMFGGSGEDKTKLAEGDVALPIVKPLKDGTVVHSFAETLGGVEIAGKPLDPVAAAEAGRVLLVTDDKTTGRTVVIQHAGSRVTVYGHLGRSDVAESDWVDAGQTVGTLGPAASGETSLLFFAVKEKGRYVNPADVVPLD